MGLNPSIADAYFDRLEGAADDTLEQNADFLQALAQIPDSSLSLGPVTASEPQSPS